MKIPNLRGSLAGNRVIVQNAASIVGTAGLNSALGFLYWWLAARVFPPAAVGLASAGISAMMLLGMMGTLGLGTALIGELPRRPGEASGLLTTALATSGAASAVLGVLFALAAPYLSPELAPYAAGIASLGLFALGVALTSVTQVFDDALIGLYRGHYQLWRNGFFVIAKLVLLFAASKWLASKLGLTIYATWVLGSLLSLVFIALLAPRQSGGWRSYRPQWGRMRSLSRAALGHHALNISLQAPGLMLPVVVAVLLSTSVNAAFYIAWMVAGFVFIAPRALTTVLYAVGSDNPRLLGEKSRLTVKLSLVAVLPAAAILFVAAGPILHLFGVAYAEQAQSSLRILSLAAVAVIVKSHYVAQIRVEERTARSVPVMALAALSEVAVAALGARLGGLNGLCLGWLAVMYLEAALMAPSLHRMMTAAPEPHPAKPAVERAARPEAVPVEERITP